MNRLEVKLLDNILCGRKIYYFGFTKQHYFVQPNSDGVNTAFNSETVGQVQFSAVTRANKVRAH